MVEPNLSKELKQRSLPQLELRLCLWNNCLHGAWFPASIYDKARVLGRSTHRATGMRCGPIRSSSILLQVAPCRNLEHIARTRGIAELKLFSQVPTSNRVGNKTKATMQASSNKAERTAIAETLEARVASHGQDVYDTAER